MTISKKQNLYRNRLNQIQTSHSLWNNELLIACENGNLTKDDFKFLFSQYYCYSKNFTKLLAAALVKCDNDLHRAKLSANLWEESGELELEKRHAEIFRKFLVEGLELDLKNIKFEAYSELFIKEYLELCLNSKPYECFSMLAFGTEGIVSRLYKIFRKGLLNAGFKDKDLLFFNIHIECDDDHAFTLEEMALSYTNEEHWQERSAVAVNAILDLRDNFFKNIYRSLQVNKFANLINNISFKKEDLANELIIKNCVKSIANHNSKLYANKDIQQQIDFTVDRVDFNAEVLDPRLVNIPINSSNELHSHAHETVFLILEGKGSVFLNGKELPVKKGDLVYVPRWYEHQTKNTGQEELKFFAVTDYGFTKTIATNTESIYRKNKEYLFKRA